MSVHDLGPYSIHREICIGSHYHNDEDFLGTDPFEQADGDYDAPAPNYPEAEIVGSAQKSTEQGRKS